MSDGSTLKMRLLSGLALLLLVGCPRLNEEPPQAAGQPEPPASPASDPAPLPPEETAPEPQAAPLDPPNVSPVEPGITAAGGPTRGALPKPVIDERLKAVGPEIQACYERGLKATPGLRGNVNIAFVVATDGKVVHAEASEVEEPLTDERTLGCIVALIRQLDFPPPKGGRVFLNYPLKLEPATP